MAAPDPYIPIDERQTDHMTSMEQQAAKLHNAAVQREKDGDASFLYVPGTALNEAVHPLQLQEDPRDTQNYLAHHDAAFSTTFQLQTVDKERQSHHVDKGSNAREDERNGAVSREEWNSTLPVCVPVDHHDPLISPQVFDLLAMVVQEDLNASSGQAQDEPLECAAWDASALHYLLHAVGCIAAGALESAATLNPSQQLTMPHARYGHLTRLFERGQLQTLGDIQPQVTMYNPWSVSNARSEGGERGGLPPQEGDFNKSTPYTVPASVGQAAQAGPAPPAERTPADPPPPSSSSSQEEQLAQPSLARAVGWQRQRPAASSVLTTATAPHAVTSPPPRARHLPDHETQPPPRNAPRPERPPRSGTFAEESQPPHNEEQERESLELATAMEATRRDAWRRIQSRAQDQSLHDAPQRPPDADAAPPPVGPPGALPSPPSPPPSPTLPSPPPSPTYTPDTPSRSPEPSFAEATSRERARLREAREPLDTPSRAPRPPSPMVSRERFEALDLEHRREFEILRNAIRALGTVVSRTPNEAYPLAGLPPPQPSAPPPALPAPTAPAVPPAPPAPPAPEPSAVINVDALPDQLPCYVCLEDTNRRELFISPFHVALCVSATSTPVICGGTRICVGCATAQSPYHLWREPHVARNYQKCWICRASLNTASLWEWQAPPSHASED